MRDRFKFRVYIKYSKSLHDIDSFYIDKLKKKVTIHFTDCHTKSFKFEDIILMQCTGLKDKNGNLVYEGDHIKCCYRSKYVIGVIMWDEDELAFGLKHKGVFYSVKPRSYFDTIEIIGNIHENPELLEKE